MGKHILPVLLVVLLVFLAGGALADTHILPMEPADLSASGITQDDAVTIAENELVTREGVAGDDWQSYRIKATGVRLETGEEAWMVLLDHQQYGTDALVTVSADNAAVIDYQATDTEIISAVVNLWTMEKGTMNTWSIEEQALFELLFGTSNEYVVPGDDYISQEEAGNIALSAVPQTSATREPSYAFKKFSYTDGRPDAYVWLVTVWEYGQEKYVVHVSATDGAVLKVFTPSNNG